GIIGTAPAQGHIRTGHGGPTGGNLDLPFVRAGSLVYLPVQRPGGMPYLGDAHAPPAHGEPGGLALGGPAQAGPEVGLRPPAPRWLDPDPSIAAVPALPPVVIAGTEPLSRSRGIAVVGVSPELGRLDRAVVEAYRSAVRLVKLACQRVSWGESRNLV